MASYNINKIEDYYIDFKECFNNFKTYKSDWISTALYTSSNSSAVKIKAKINDINGKIESYYKKVDVHWQKYNNDLKAMYKTLETNKLGSFETDSIKTYASNMVKQDFSFDTGAVVNNAKNQKNAVVVDVSKEVAADFLISTGASAINLCMAFGFGLLKFAEGLLDGITVACGYVAAGLYALSTMNTTGSISEGFNETMNSFYEFVGTDLTGMAKDAFYSSAAGSAINDRSFGLAKNDGFLYSVSESLGEVTGTVLLTAATGGAINPGVIYGVSQLGKKTETGYNKLAAETGGNLSNKDMHKLFWSSAAMATVEGVAFGLTYGKGLKAKSIGKGKSYKEVTEKGLKGLVQKASTLFDNHSNSEKLAKAFIEATKSTGISVCETLLYDGNDKIESWDFWKGTLKKAGVEAATSLIWEYRKNIIHPFKTKQNITNWYKENFDWTALDPYYEDTSALGDIILDNNSINNIEIDPDLKLETQVSEKVLENTKSFNELFKDGTGKIKSKAGKTPIKEFLSDSEGFAGEILEDLGLAA